MAGHVMGGSAVEVPIIKLVAARATVEVGTSSRLLDVEVNNGLSAED